MLFSSEEDFLTLILRIYQSQNSGLKRLFASGETKNNIEDKIMMSRYLIKTFKGCEKESLPLPSVLKLHILRSEFLVKLMTMEDFDLLPEDNGWVYNGNEFIMQLQSEDDPYYDLPKKNVDWM